MTDPDDAPPLTDAFFNNAEVFHGNTFIRQDSNKDWITVRLDPDVLAKLREAGPGWQSRINGMLREALGLE